MKPYVAGIASGVGGGKTTLVERLAHHLGDASAIHFDHYERVTERPIEAIRQWLRDGADPDAFEIARLGEDLRLLKEDCAVDDPATGARILARKYLLFEAPFGRRHSATGRYIDFLVWIDTPFDLALARKIRQLTADAEARHAAGFHQWLRTYLDNYVDVVAGLLRRQHDTVRADADLVVDGTLDPEALAGEVARIIRTRFS